MKSTFKDINRRSLESTTIGKMYYFLAWIKAGRSQVIQNEHQHTILVKSVDFIDKSPSCQPDRKTESPIRETGKIRCPQISLQQYSTYEEP